MREGAESLLTAFVEGLTSVIGHRAKPLHDYCTGLVMPSERKSIEPMAAGTAPARVGAQHQSLLHFVGEASWSDERVGLTYVAGMPQRSVWALGTRPLPSKTRSGQGRPPKLIRRDAEQGPICRDAPGVQLQWPGTGGKFYDAVALMGLHAPGRFPALAGRITENERARDLSIVRGPG